MWNCQVNGGGGSLWFRVLAARFGEGSIFVHADGGRGSVWWRNLVSNGRDVGATAGNQIDNNCVCEVDDGNSFLFWWDPWMEDVALKVMFSRIFELSGNKMATVAEMERLGWGENGETWKWCRPL